MWHYRLKRASDYGKLSRKHRRVYRRSKEETPKVPMLFIAFGSGVLVFIPGIVITFVPQYAFGNVHNTMVYDFMGPLCLVVSLFLFGVTVVAWLRQRRKIRLLRALLEENDEENAKDEEALYNKVQDRVRINKKRKRKRRAPTNQENAILEEDESGDAEMLELDAVHLQLPPPYQRVNEGPLPNASKKVALPKGPADSLGSQTRAPSSGNDDPTIVYDV